MSAGPPSGYFHPQHEWYELLGRDAERGRPGGSDRGWGMVPHWTSSQTSSINRPVEMESTMYARPPYVEDGYMQRHVGAGIPFPLAIRRPPQLHVQPRTVTTVAAAPFPALASHASRAQAYHSIDGMDRQPDRPPARSNPFGVGPRLHSDLTCLEAVDGPSRDTVEAIPASQAWEETVATAFGPQTGHPLQIRSRDESRPTRIPPRSFIDGGVTPVDTAHPQVADASGDEDVCTFFCEWTDERGTCNMEILGDRIWVSHHLGHHHNVVGHEKSQRACLWLGCSDTMNKGSLARHVVSRHLRAGTSCGFCSKVYSRADVARRHVKKCKAANGVSVQQNPTK